MLLSEAFDRYRQDVIVFRNQSPKTEENHEVCKKALIKYTGDIRVQDLTFDTVRKWKLHLEKKRGPTTVRCYIIKLRVVLEYMDVIGIECLKTRQIPVPKRRDTVPAYLSKDQVTLLIDSTSRLKNKCIISFLYASGVRIGELCQLDREDIRGKEFSVIGKGGKARLCFIDERTETLLKLYLESRSDNQQALFLTDSKQRITPGVVQETFKSVRKRSGLQCSPHTMRHSYATNLMKNGMHIYTLSRLLGHKSISTTEQYLHVSDPDLQKNYKEYHTI